MIPFLQTDKIQFILKDSNKPVLYETNLQIFPGEFVVILGHNGSGKSTLLKILSGDILPSSGKVLINQIELSQISIATRARDFLTLTQVVGDRLFLELTVEENITLWESRFPTSKRLSNEQILKITSFGPRFLNMLKQPVSTLSGGEKQMLLIILALAHPPKILYLDEHTSALDHKLSDNIMSKTAEAVCEKKITTIMVTHRLDDALHYGDRLIILNEGVIVINQKKSSNLSIKELKDLMEKIPSF
jgi:putative tryptophan/tyrosine transport system ATP-binding protein